MSDHSVADLLPRPGWPARLQRRVARDIRLGIRAAGRGAVEFYHSDNLTFAASIAYYALLSIFPFSLLVLAVLGRIRLEGTGATLLQLIARALPSRFEFLGQIDKLAEGAVQLSVAGALLMLWAAMGVFGALTSAVNHAWGVEKGRSFFKHKLNALAMLIGAALLMVITLLIVSTGQLASSGWFGSLIARWPALAELRGFVFRNAPTPLFILVVGLIYYYAPNAKVRMRDVWVGALLAGLLWRLAFELFSWYLRDLSRFSVHGSVAAVIVFLVWVYLSAAILLYGAEVSAAYARLRKDLPQQAPAAAVRDA